MSFVRSLAKLRHKSPVEPPQWLIVGLGNPGAQYAKTRHNIGFMCLNRIAHRAGVRFKSSAKDRADITPATIAGTPALLAQPQTYMNESGAAASRLVKRLQLDPDRVILIYDDVDLPLMTVRVRQAGSAGGHRGVQSIVDALRTDDIPRVRVGIGRGAGSTKEYVLTEFSSAERPELQQLCDVVAEIVESILTEGVIVAMNRYNGSAAKRVSVS